ncbi:hypothetical protein IW15_04520 [Chryseobacterium soli]|uniref:TonB C-terminal domain-containing protein n=1 Tax=Chryseobacterium soli TaxID=445961 RepID=A0A086ADD6_9FLAO|nr:hypothetical protein [Chryseobacterium soli]KFF14700.1 hypothetical protein IW15_04520 [Chryseobacterium soli]
MKTNKLLLLFTLLIFSVGYSQIEQIKKIDSIFDKKTEEIPVKNKNSKKYWKYASEINSQRIAEYDQLLHEIYQKDCAEIPTLQIQQEDKIINYKNNGISGFREEMFKNVNLQKHPFLPNLTGLTLKSELKWVIDENGSIKKVEAIGENEAFNTLTKIALYKTEGNWIPAQKNERNIRSSFRFPITIQIE